jgi:hypothetical protein
VDINFNTTQLDASLVVNAYAFYKSGDYERAISALLGLLNIEPRNWQARLILGACYFHVNQKPAAQQAFRFVHDNCHDHDIARKAGLALQTVNAELLKDVMPPADSGKKPAAGAADSTLSARINRIIE